MELIDCRLAVGDDTPVGDLPVWINCLNPEHDDHNPSMAVYCDHIHCYACGFGVHTGANDTLAFLLGVTWKELKKPDANGVTLRDKYTMANLDAYRERVTVKSKEEPLSTALARGYQQHLWGFRKDRLQWLYDRGLSQEWIMYGMLGHSGTQFTIPIFNRNFDLLNIRFRIDEYYGTERWDGKELHRYSGIEKRNGVYLYGEHWLNGMEGEDEHIVVCEGELDALRLKQEGIPSVGVTNGAGNLRHIPKLIEPYTSIKRVYICSDMDEKGRVAGSLLHKDLTSLGYSSIMMEWGEEYGKAKDITEYLLNGGTMKDAGYRG